MAYEYITKYSSPFYGGTRVPKGIVIHHWDDPAKNPQFYPTLEYLVFNAGPSQRASVNYVTEAGKVACIVDPDNIAWGQGDGGSGWGNLNCISIEANPRCSAGDLETLAELIADIWAVYGKLPLYPHSNFTGTQCPGRYLAKLGWLNTRATQILAAKKGSKAPVKVAPKPVVKPAPKPVVKPSKPATGLRNTDKQWIFAPGETMTHAAKYFNTSVSALAKFNGVKDPNKVKVGENVWPPIPGAGLWIVDPGDTLTKIAKYYGTTVDAIKKANGLKSDRIVVGQRIIVL